jgi:hypothetical protein
MTRTLAASIVTVVVGLSALPEAGQVTKIQRLPDSYKFDDRLMVVSSEGTRSRRCVGASVGNFAILTNYACLADWWTNKNDYSVRYASDTKREHFWGGFQRAHRSGDDGRWALLETPGHSIAYYGYENLDQVVLATGERFDFVGFSKKVKGGRELAIQTDCRLNRSSPGRYTSECGRDFDASGILILRSAAGHRYVSGIATVQANSTRGTSLTTLDVVSQSEYGTKLRDLRRDQESRYASVMARRETAVSEQRISGANAAAEAEARRARRQADLEKIMAAAGELATTLGGGRRTAPPPAVYPSPAPPVAKPVVPVAPASRPRSGHWECGQQTRCVGGSLAELPPGGMAQLRLVDGQSNVLAYLNIYWTSLGPANAINQRLLTVTVGIGSSCQLTSDVGFHVNGQIRTFLGGIGTGPEVAPNEYRKVTREFYIPEGATITVDPGAAYCAGVL